MEFNVWDIGGPASMSTVNQCFFTDKALYIVVWNLALGEEAVANLQFWLLNIEVRSHWWTLGYPFIKLYLSTQIYDITDSIWSAFKISSSYEFCIAFGINFPLHCRRIAIFNGLNLSFALFSFTHIRECNKS